jgi:hypothetical protein
MKQLDQDRRQNQPEAPDRGIGYDYGVTSGYQVTRPNVPVTVPAPRKPTVTTHLLARLDLRKSMHLQVTAAISPA